MVHRPLRSAGQGAGRARLRIDIILQPAICRTWKVHKKVAVREMNAVSRYPCYSCRVVPWYSVGLVPVHFGLINANED